LSIFQIASLAIKRLVKLRCWFVLPLLTCCSNTQVTMDASDSNPPAEDIKMEGGDSIPTAVVKEDEAASSPAPPSPDAAEDSTPIPPAEATTMATEETKPDIPVTEEEPKTDEPMEQGDDVPASVTEASDVPAPAAANDSLPPTEPAAPEDSLDGKLDLSTPVEPTAKIEDLVKTNGSRLDVEEGKEVLPEPEPIKAEEPIKVKEAKLAKPEVINNNAPTLKKPKIDTSSLPTRQYLDQTVVPILLQGLSWLAKTRPDDPISKLSSYLLEHKQEYENGHSPSDSSGLLGTVASSSTSVI